MHSRFEDRPAHMISPSGIESICGMMQSQARIWSMMRAMFSDEKGSEEHMRAAALAGNDGAAASDACAAAELVAGSMTWLRSDCVYMLLLLVLLMLALPCLAESDWLVLDVSCQLNEGVLGSITALESLAGVTLL